MSTSFEFGTEQLFHALCNNSYPWGTHTQSKADRRQRRNGMKYHALNEAAHLEKTLDNLKPKKGTHDRTRLAPKIIIGTKIRAL